MRQMVTALVATGVVVTSACGDDGESASPREFCEGAESFMNEGAAFNEPGSAAADAALDEAEELDPPDEIAADWSTLIRGARALAELDAEDPGSSGGLPPEAQEMAAASSNVYRYLGEECGLTNVTAFFPEDTNPE